MRKSTSSPSPPSGRDTIGADGSDRQCNAVMSNARNGPERETDKAFVSLSVSQERPVATRMTKGRGGGQEMARHTQT